MNLGKKQGGAVDRLAGRMLRRSIVGMVLIVVVAAPAWAWAQAPDNAAPLARYAPREALVGFMEYQGVDAHEAAWKGSAAYKLFTETKFGPLIDDVIRQLIVNSGMPVSADDFLASYKLILRRGMVLAVWGKDPEELGMVIVFRDGAKPEFRRFFETMERAGRPVQPQAEEAREQPDARQIHQFPNSETSWWYEKDDLVVTTRPQEVVDILEGKAPSAVDHPRRQELFKPEGSYTPGAVAFVDFGGMPKLPPQAIKLGFDGIKQIDFTWGFEGDAMRTVIHAVAPSPRRGLLAMVDQPAFDAGSLPPIPANVRGFIVVSVDWSKTFDRVVEMIKAAQPGGPDIAEAAEQGINQTFGFSLKKDLIAGLGHRLVFSMQEPAGPAGRGRAAAMINRSGGATIAIDVRDEAALARASEGLIKAANLALAQALGQPGGDGGLSFHKEDSPRPKYVLDLPQGMLPPPFSTLYRPTIIFGKDQLVIGASTAAADKVAALSADKPDGRWKADDAYAAVMKHVPAKLVYLRVNDPRETIPAVVEALPILAEQVNQQVAAQRRQFQGGPGQPLLKIEPENLPRAEELVPHLFPAFTAMSVDDQGANLITREPVPGITSPAVFAFWGALLLPAVSASREAAHRAQCTNNLKQMMLAFHNIHSATNAFPAPAITDKDGKPLLSWRVAILPYVEQQALYNKFKLDEPWDSPNNKPLIKEMPSVFLCASRKKAEPGTTTYRVFVGEGALFDEMGQGVGLQAITDGTSNTIAIVESDDAVPWTKPEGLKFDAKAKPALFGAGSPHPGGLNVGFCDGSVHFIKRSITMQVWKALLTRAGGEVVNAAGY